MAFIAVQSLWAQETPGITQGNFAGSQMVHLNPANIFQSKVFMDVQVASASIFTQNNFAFIPSGDYPIFDLFKTDANLPTYDGKDNNFTYRKNIDNKEGSLVSRMGGLSSMILIENHAFAINTSIRAFSSVIELPYEIPVFGIEDLSYRELHNVPFYSENTKVAGMVWGEIGLSYSYVINKYRQDHFAVGASIKGILPYSGVFLNIDNIDYMVIDNLTNQDTNYQDLSINKLNAKVGFALPIDYDSPEFGINNDKIIKGFGLGFDLGFTYTKKKNTIQRSNTFRYCEVPFTDYNFRLGISIIDIGFANLKNNAQVHSYDDISTYWEEVKFTDSIFQNAIKEISANLYNGDTEASFIANKFSIGLPTALSIQFDYNIANDIYVNALWVHPIPIFENSLVRPAQIAVTGRYETQKFEFGVPVSLYNYHLPRVGLFARLGFFTFGTERLGNWLGISDIDGLDFYASVKINLRRGVCIGGGDSGACANDDIYRRAMGKRPGWR